MTGVPRGAAAGRRRPDPLLLVVSGALLAMYGAWALVDARVAPVEAFDGGITSGSAVALLDGRLALVDFYSPYGLALGAPGALVHALGFDGLFAERVAYNLFRPLMAVLGVWFVWGRAGRAAGLVSAFVLPVAMVPRYTWSWALLFGALLVLDAGARRASEPTLRSIAAERPRWLAMAVVLFATMGWVRTEYAVVGVVFGLLLAVLLRGQARWVWSAAAVALSALPALLVVVLGGADGLWAWLDYAVRDFRTYRGQPVVWGDLRLGGEDARVAVIAYGMGGLTVVVSLAAACTAGGRRWFAEDGTGVRLLLVILCAIVLQAQLARYSAAYAALGTPVFWLPFLLWLGTVLRGRSVAVTTAGVAACVLIAMPLWTYESPADAAREWGSRTDWRARDAVPGLNRISARADEWSAWASLAAHWRAAGLDGQATTPVNRRNDLAWANELFVNDLLDAPPAIWLWVYDPGLANREDIQRQAVDELCDRRPHLVQKASLDAWAPPPMAPARAREPGSTSLDAFLAASYRPIAQPVDRILRFEACRRPWELPAAQVAALRDDRLAAGEVPEAAHLARAHGDRAGAPEPIDVGLLAATGLPLPPGWAERAGRLAPAVASLRAGVPAPELDALAADPQLTAAERFVVLAAAAQGRDPASREPAPASARLREAARENAVELPIGATVTHLRQLDPFDVATWRRLRARGADPAGMELWWVDTTAHTGRPEWALRHMGALAAALEPTGRTVELGQAEILVGSVLGRRDAACAVELLRRGDARAGVRYLGGGLPQAPQRCPVLAEEP